jgi:transposase
VGEVLAAHLQLRLYRLPSYSPPLNVIERFWRVLRRRATHNRLFASMVALRTTLRNNISYFQTMRHKMLSLIESLRKAKKEAKIAAARISVRFHDKMDGN